MIVRDIVLDQMALARDMRVEALSTDSAGARYRISLEIVLSPEAREKLGTEAGRQGQRVTAMLRRYAAKGLRTYLTPDDGSAPADEPPNGKPPISHLNRVTEKVMGRYGE